MNCHGTKHLSLSWAACCALLGALLVMAPTAQAVVIVNDSWADGGRNNGARSAGLQLVDLQFAQWD